VSPFPWSMCCWCRRSNGRAASGPGVEELLQRHPHLAGDDNAVLDLIYNEVVLRETAGQRPEVDDYLRRFPHLAADLRVQFEVDQALTPGRADRWGRVVQRHNGPHARALAFFGTSWRIAQRREGRRSGWTAATCSKRWAAAPWAPCGGPGSGTRAALGGRQAAVFPMCPRLRVRTEVEAATRLSHPNIVQVFEGPRAGGTDRAGDGVRRGRQPVAAAGWPAPASARRRSPRRDVGLGHGPRPRPGRPSP